MKEFPGCCVSSGVDKVLITTVYLLTGVPGTGKTTLIRQLAGELGDKAGGFYTEEIRLGGIRQGFRIVTLDGHSATLAHMQIRSPYRVGKYGVDTEALDRVGVAALERALSSCEVVVVDEIGKMELFSEKFRAAILKAIDGSEKILGTIMLKSDPWTDSIKQKPRVKLVSVTRNNHREVLDNIEIWLGIKNTKVK